ncbi:MAG: hypothetical protein WCQ41_05890 [Bacillota bacterium]
MIKRQKNTYILLSIVFIIFAAVFSVTAYLETTKFQDMQKQVLAKNEEFNVIKKRSEYLKIISKNSTEMVENNKLLANRIGLNLENFQGDISFAFGYSIPTKIEPIVDNGNYKERKFTIELKNSSFDSLRTLVYTLKYPADTSTRCFRLDGIKYSVNKGVVNATLELAAFSFISTPS